MQPRLLSKEGELEHAHTTCSGWHKWKSLTIPNLVNIRKKRLSYPWEGRVQTLGRPIGQYLLFCPHLFFCFFQKNFRTILYAGNFNNSISTGGGNGKPLQYSCLESPISSMKRQKDMTLEDEPFQPPRLEGVQYATGEKWRTITNRSRKKCSWAKAQLWMCLVVKVKSNAVKNNIANSGR